MKFFTDVFLGIFQGVYEYFVYNQLPHRYKGSSWLVNLIVTVVAYALTRLIKLSLIIMLFLFDNRHWVLLTLVLGTVFQLLNQQP